jgi:3-methyl-2-oxobutanoate hydroxymethyltransferase
MIYHTACVARAVKRSFVVSDLPFASYASIQDAVKNSASLMQAGAHMVKMEGGRHLAQTVEVLTRNGIPVCAHLGLTPQSVNH